MTELDRHLDALRSIPGANLVLSTPPAGFARRHHEHRHAYVSLTLAGGWRETYRGRAREAGPGRYAVHLPEARHARVHTEPGARELYLELDPENLPRRWQRSGERPRWSVAGPLMHALFVDLALAHDDPLHVEALIAELLDALFGADRRAARPSPEWIRRVGDTLEDRLAGPPTLRELARELGTHPSHVARTFRAAFGVSVGQFVQRLRIGRALAALSATDRELASIAAGTGFSDQSHFGRVFRREVGVSPGRYRRLVRS